MLGCLVSRWGRYPPLGGGAGGGGGVCNGRYSPALLAMVGTLLRAEAAARPSGERSLRAPPRPAPWPLLSAPNGPACPASSAPERPGILRIIFVVIRIQPVTAIFLRFCSIHRRFLLRLLLLPLLLLLILW